MKTIVEFPGGLMVPEPPPVRPVEPPAPEPPDPDAAPLDPDFLAWLDELL